MSWKNKYKVVGVKPGPVVTPRHGRIDLRRDDLPLKTMDELYKDKVPYLEKIHETKPETKKNSESPDS